MQEIKDGIINNELYKNSFPKVLWILKEGNVSEKDKNMKRDICDEINNGQHISNALSIPTFRKMIYATYSIFKPDIDWADIPLANNRATYDIFRQVGYINVNKLPGNATSVYQIMKHAYLKYEKLLINQIIEMNPNIIILGGTLKFFTYEACEEIGFDIRKVEKQISLNGTASYYKISKDKLLINAFHPAYFRVSDKEYIEGIRSAVENW